jgi:hypothetical protein
LECAHAQTITSSGGKITLMALANLSSFATIISCFD